MAIQVGELQVRPGRASVLRAGLSIESAGRIRRGTAVTGRVAINRRTYFASNVAVALGARPSLGVKPSLEVIQRASLFERGVNSAIRLGASCVKVVPLERVIPWGLQWSAIDDANEEVARCAVEEELKPKCSSKRWQQIGFGGLPKSIGQNHHLRVIRAVLSKVRLLRIFHKVFKLMKDLMDDVSP